MCGAYFRVIKDKESTVNKYGSSSIFNSCQCVAACCANFKKITLIGSLIAEVMKSTFFFPEAFFHKMQECTRNIGYFSVTVRHLVGLDPKTETEAEAQIQLSAFCSAKPWPATKSGWTGDE